LRVSGIIPGGGGWTRSAAAATVRNARASMARVTHRYLVAGHPGRGCPGIQRPGDHPQRQPGLGRERGVFGDARGGAALFLLDPQLRKVEFPVDQRVPGRGGVGEVDATWAFSTRPAVPVYCRCTPTVAVPFLTSTVSSTTSAACGSPRCSITKARRSSRTPSASQDARDSRCCIPPGLSSPACSAMVQQFLRGSPAIKPRMNARARRRGSTLPNRPPIRSTSSSRMPSHRPGSTLWPAATARSSRVCTNRDHQTVAVPRPAVQRSR
jgi:hypothetical protein